MDFTAEIPGSHMEFSLHDATYTISTKSKKNPDGYLSKYKKAFSKIQSFII